MLVTIQETWLGKKRFRIPGRYVRLLSTLNPVNVKLGRGMKYFDSFDLVEAGAWSRVRPGEPDFDSVMVETSTSELCKFMIADGDAGYDRLITSAVSALACQQEAFVTCVTSTATYNLVLAPATRRKVVFRAPPSNQFPVYLWGTDQAAGSNNALSLQPDDKWVEIEGASLQWGVKGLPGDGLYVQSWL